MRLATLIVLRMAEAGNKYVFTLPVWGLAHVLMALVGADVTGPIMPASLLTFFIGHQACEALHALILEKTARDDVDMLDDGE